MSKFWIYLKTNIRADLKQGHILAGTFILLPLFFSFLMGFSFSSAFVPEVSIEPIQISLQNENQGEAGDLLSEMLKSDAMNAYIEVVDEEASDFHLLIQPEYTEHFEHTPLTIETKENSSKSEENILAQLITAWQQAVVDQETLSNEVAAIENPTVVEQLMTDLEALGNLNMEDIFTTQAYESSRALTSNQFTSVAGIMYILFLTLSHGTQMSTNKELRGIRKRQGVIPLSPREAVLYEIGTNTVIYTVICILYVMIWRLIDATTFTGNPLFYVVWLIIYTLFFQALNAALLHVVPDKLANVFYQGILMLYMLFGFLPIETMVGGEVGEFFSQNFIRKIFNQPFYAYMTEGHIVENMGIASGLLIVSLVIIFVIVQIKKRRELQSA